MAFEVEVPVRHRTMWLAFTDPEKMARAVPGLTVDAVHPVPAVDGAEGVAGDVVAGRLKLRVGGAGATITYRGTACIAGVEAHQGTLDIAIDAAQARGNGALAGYLRITLTQVGDDGERTLVSVAPELELSGRALQFAREDWHQTVEALGTAWVEALAAEFRIADESSVTAADETAEASEAVEPSEAAEPAEAVEAAEAVEVVEAVASAEPAAAAEFVAEPAEAPEPAEPVEPAELAEPAVPAEPEPAAAAEPANESQESDSESEKIAANPAIPAAAEASDVSLSDDPLAVVWNGRYEKNRWLPLITALAFFLLIKRRRRHRADNQGADSSFWME